MTAEHDGRAGMDALMAALTDEPLSDAARADAAFMAEHRSAEADLALLREQLGIIGRTLADPPTPTEAPVPVPVRRSRPRRRTTLNLAFGGLAVACAAALLSGMAWLLAQAGGGMDAGASSDSAASKEDSDAGSVFGGPHYFACSRLIAEGRATSVERLPGTESFRVTIDVTRYYKPEKPGADDKKELTYVIDGNVVPGLREGDQVLFAVPNGERQPEYWLVGEKQIARDRARLTVSAAESRGLPCA
ncbi:hypothetical protein ACFWWT_28335 [Streptomyces sp. NPDC058676]|uniref:hypothetical protein n=1 Tax=unclassified Streptomyces TaxID=2593676 RepID=UPI003652F749